MWARAILPEAKLQNVSDVMLNSVLQEGAYDVAGLCEALPKNQKFTATADVGEYSLSSSVTRFVKLHKSGLYWNNGSQYKQLDAVTTKWLDENVANWRDVASGSPIYFYQEGDTLGVHPKPSVTLSNGFWLYFFQKPVEMSTEDHYPFGGATEDSRLYHLSHNILDYWKWKGSEIMGKTLQETAALKALYEDNATKSKDRIIENAAVANGRLTRMRGKRVTP